VYEKEWRFDLEEDGGFSGVIFFFFKFKTNVNFSHWRTPEISYH